MGLKGLLVPKEKEEDRNEDREEDRNEDRDDEKTKEKDDEKVTNEGRLNWIVILRPNRLYIEYMRD